MEGERHDTAAADTTRDEPASARVGLRYATGVLVTPVLRAAIAYHAVPAARPWRYACDNCGSRLRYPWLSAAFTPAGRCRHCGRRVAAAGFLVELAAAATAVILVVAGRPWPETVAFAWWAGFALVLAFVDTAVHRLPDRLTLPAAAGTIVLLGLAALVEHNGAALLRAVEAAAGGALLFAILTLLLGRHGTGPGDAKLMLSTLAVLGWISWPAVLAGLFVAFAAQSLAGLALLAARATSRPARLPLGPFLFAATLVTILIGPVVFAGLVAAILTVVT